MKWLLLGAILIVAVLPLVASFYFLDHSLRTSLNLGFNREIVDVLETSSQNLRRLKTVDAQNEVRYREQFDRIENLKLIYSKPDLVKDNVLGSLKIYFGMGLLAVVLMSVVISGLLGGRIAGSYASLFHELIGQREKVRYLEEISSWQELAKILAHEIKNPLTPIEVLVTSLKKAHAKKSEVDFREQLSETEVMIHEELGQLKMIVNRFSEFSKIPQVQLEETNLVSFIRQNLKSLSTSFDRAVIEFAGADAFLGGLARIDSMLLKQVFANIVRNGVEANPQRKIRFTIGLSQAGESFRIAIANDGVPVPREMAPRIFDPYISSKAGKENMGLGLAIVKKIVIEHGGEVSYVEEKGCPTFVISLPRSR